jgi:adenine C2-methylase RlmN of 23S rRNA A2503 and tRNA A37
VFKETDAGLRIHHALIKDVNDHERDVEDIHEWLQMYGIFCPVNIVRYNSFGVNTGEESDIETIEKYIKKMKESPNVTSVQLVSRVGRDVEASCGTFVSADT